MAEQQKTISRDADGIPSSVSKEKLSAGLAGLAVTPELQRLSASVLSQWAKRDRLEKLAAFGVYPTRKILLYGPPGNGKTTCCQWMASKLKVDFYLVRTDALVGSYLGTTANNIRETMDWIAKVGPAVVLFDEVETLFLSRDNADGTCGRELSSAMATFWQMLDRWASPQLFCFATNMPEKLDKALMSRFELQLYFGPPTWAQVNSVVEYWSEVFHEYAPDTWAQSIRDAEHVSFRSLWQSISAKVLEVALR